jgi:heptosyltransferase III
VPPAGEARPPRRALVVRAGALGDVLLLRRAVAILNAASIRVGLVAPGAAGRCLVGLGPTEVACCFDSERAEMAALWTQDAEPPAPVREFLGDDALAYVVSDDGDLAASLARSAGCTIACPPAPPPGVHASEWLARPLASLGLPAADPLAPLAFAPAETSAARAWRERLPDRFLALHPGSGSPRKNWPSACYAELARVLAPNEPFLVVRGPADDEAAAPLLQRPNAVDATDLPLRTLGALLSDAGAFVGNDSGVTHLAAAAGAPTLALFGPTDPEQWAPVGASVRVLRAQPLDGLAVPDVAAAASTLWERSRERGPRSR